MPSYIAQAHMQVSLHVQFIAHAKAYFYFLFCDYYILHIKRTFPNIVYTDGKTFCLNRCAEYLKRPSTLELHFDSKYFVISVADQLNQNSFMNQLLMESSNCSYTHI